MNKLDNMFTSLSTKFRKLATLTIAALVLGIGAFWGFQYSEAGYNDPLVMIITVDGQSGTVNVVNGVPVLVEWYVDGPVNSCEINNGVGPINVSTLPAMGSRTITPTADAQTSFTLTCDTGSTGVVVDMNKPTVSMSVVQGPVVTADSLTGNAFVQVKWSTTHADQCSVVSWAKDSSPGTYTYANLNKDYVGYKSPAGRITFDGNPWAVTESSTFRIACYNSNIGTAPADAVWASTKVKVLQPQPPGPASVNVTSPDAPSVTADPILGYAYADVSYTSQEVTQCYRSAFNDSGAQITVPGWSTDTNTAVAKTYTNLRLVESTTFRVRCVRPAVTIGGTFYPQDEATDSIRIAVNPPAGVSNLNNWDRTDPNVPPATASMTVSPNPVAANNITGLGRISINVQSTNTDYCVRRAERMDGSSIWIYGWSGNKTFGGSYTSSMLADISTTTKLIFECERTYDMLYGTPAEQANASASDQEVVVLIPSLIPAPLPTVGVYGNAVKMTAFDMWNKRTKVNGFLAPKKVNPAASGPAFIEGNKVNSTIDFTFSHPFGQSESYDIFLHFCDENDAVSDVSVSVNGTLVGSLTTDNATIRPGCWNANNYPAERVASMVTVSHGDTITVSCDNVPVGDRDCNIAAIYFGAGNGSSLLVAPIGTTDTSVNTGVFWYSENTLSCPSHIATRQNGSTYTFSNNSNTWGYERETISTTTTFTSSCTRTVDNQVGSGYFTAVLPFGGGQLVVSALVATGQCIDPNTLTVGDAPPGYMADPVTGLCVPAVDLAAASPSVNMGGASGNNIDGTYDNVNVLTAIRNLGPGELTSGNDISYTAEFIFDSYIESVFGSPTLNAIVKNFNGSLAAPTSGSFTESGILTLNFDDVPFGDHQICARVNLDGSPNFPEYDTTFTNNTNCELVSIPVPEPPMSISADPDIIRNGQTSDITWSAHTSYPLNCTVIGAGGINDTFRADQNYISSGSGAYTDTVTTGPLTGKSEFIIECTEPHTNTTFQESVWVELVPDIEET